MAKFRYSLQSILDIKLQFETQAKNEFAAAINALREEEMKLEALYKRKSLYEKEANELRLGELDFLKINETDNAISALDIMIADQKTAVAHANDAVEEKREKLSLVMKERKMHEKLKEKAFNEFMAEENRAESKANDELTSYKYGRKRQVKN